MLRQLFLLFLFCSLAVAQQGSLQVTPLNPTLFANSSYQVSYYTFKMLPSTATFLLDFTPTYIVVPNSALNVTASVGNSAVSGATGTCSASRCTLKLNNQVAANSNLSFVIGSLQNPYFLMNQTINTVITFNSSYSENLIWSISASYYTPMSITLNSMSQSNYGVGNQDVTYTFNLSLPMTPVNPQLTITFPTQVGIGNLQSSLTFYNSIQNLIPIVFGSNAVFPIITSANNATSGIIYLAMSGLINPQSIGTSSSFVFLLQLPSLPNAGGSCSSCTIAAITTNLLAKSTVPGNVVTLSMNSSNTAINQQNNITIYTQLMAPIPQGGMYQITLPASVQPVLPVNCMNIYAFKLTSGFPSCSYNATSNSIYTNNFFFSGIGNVVFGVTVVNPPDTRQVSFTFQTFDSTGNMIGNSAQPTYFTALPLLLTANPTKNISQVSTNFKLIVSMTLGVALTQSDFVRVILPQASYNTSAIVCISGGTNIPCNVNIDSVTNNLTVSLAPPCSLCSAGATLTFAIDSLINPSFINAYSQSIVIQTARSQGIVQQVASTLTLSLATVTITNYVRSGLLTVGSAYTMSFAYSIPPYVSANGGLLQLNFVPFDTYVKVNYNSAQSTYNYPTSVTITDSNNKIYSNTVLYDTSSNPNSITQIVISICGTNPCSNTLIISGLLRGYNPLTAMTQNVLLTTQSGDSIANSNFSILQFNPTKQTNSLAISVPNSVTTLNSNYIINFVSSYIPFQSGITLSLSNLQTINGSCFMIDNSSIFQAVFTCSVLNSTTIQINLTGDTTLMMLDVIDYKITITSVTNPPTIQPIIYSFNTQFNSVVSQTFSTTYSILNPLPLSLSYSRSNSTYAQSATLTLTLTSNYPNFSQIKLNAPSSLLTVVSGSNYTTTLSNNIFQVAQINALTNKSLTINIINPSSTTATGNIVIGMFFNGYLTAQGTVSLAAVGPVFLGVSAFTSNSIVGNVTDLTINFNRVNAFSAESSVIFNINPSLFNLASAQFNGSPLTLPLTLPISTASIVINNLQNLLSIPANPPTASISVWTIDSSSNKVAQSAFNSSNLASNVPTTALNYNFVRSNTAINGVGSLVINYTPRFASVSSNMQIILPSNQGKMSTSGCQMQTASGLAQCQIISSNSSTITVSYLGQTQTILTNVMNQQPNLNPLQVSVFNLNGELVENTSGLITPSIQMNQMTVDSQASSTLVATNSQLTFTLGFPSALSAVSKLVINIPTSTYLRIPTIYNQDCSYTIGTNNLNNCVYITDSNGWLTQVNLTNLGTTQIAASTNITVNLFVTNDWNNSPFSTTPINFYVVSSTDNNLAQGSVQLPTVYGGAMSFSTVTIGNLKVNQGGQFAGSTNNLTLSFSLAVPIPQNTVLQLNIPKSTFNMNINSLQSSLAKISTSQTSNYYTIQFQSPCAQTTPICNLANNQYSLWLVTKNNQYLQLSRNPISLQLTQGLDFISSIASVSPSPFTPLALSSPTISRSNKQSNLPTTVSLAFSTITIATFQLIISPMTTSSGNLLLINSPSFTGFSSSQSLSYTTNSTGHISININGVANGLTSLIINGTNSFVISAGVQQYLITAMDNNSIYFQSTVTPTDSLIPYGSGLTLQRIITTVGVPTQLYLSGTLPQSVSQMSVAFNNNNYPISGSTFNISLGTITNPNSLTDNNSVLISLKNSNLIAYSSQLTFTPALTSQNLTAFTSLTIPNTMNVSQNYSLILHLNSYSISYISVIVPSFMKNISMCCIDSSCSQSNINSCTISNTLDSKVSINLNLNTPQIVNTIVFKIVVLDYQLSYTNANITINSGLPSATFTTTASFSVIATPLKSSLTLSSWKVSTPSTYNLWIAPTPQFGYIGISLPSYIASQLISTTYSFSINGVVSNVSLMATGAYNFLVPINSFTTNITLTMSTVMNPSNSAPYSLNIYQGFDNVLTKISATNAYPIAMNQFDLISVTSVVRSVTKVAQPTSLTLTITTPSYTEAMIINFPNSQQFTSASCSVTANSQTLACQVINSTSIVTKNIPGTYDYTINGLYNQKYFILSASYDLIKISLGNPYTRAQTTPASTTFIAPKLTLGSITMNSLTSSSLTLLNPTTLLYNLTIQNTQNIDGFIVSYAEYFYYIPTSVTCKLNSNPASCSVLSSNQILITTPSNFINPQILLQIDGIYNFIKTGNWSIHSVQQQANSKPPTYSDIDVYSSTFPTASSMLANSINVRTMFPNNYVQANPVNILVLMDSSFDYLPTSDFKFNLTFSGINCELLNSNYQSTFNLSCTLTTSLTSNLNLHLYHSAIPSVSLAIGSKSVPILPAPTSGCSNQMCDSCSSNNGQQYCFVCRQGLYSANGQCVSYCPTGQFPYSTYQICQDCNPSCSSCFGYNRSQCMTCSNSSLLLSSGTCQQTCPLNSFNVLGNCAQSAQCNKVEGCRLCSGTGFCYQCLPDYLGAPNCQYKSPFPPTFFIFMLSPFAAITLVSIIVALAKCGGADSALSQTIFSFSFLELFAWVLTVPIMPTLMASMVLLSFLALRIIISIVSYEVFYRKNLGELSQKLLQQQSNKQSQKSDKQQPQQSNLDNFKTKFARFIAHFNGPDSYQLLKSRISEPVLSVNHHFAIHILFMVNRWIVGILMFYAISLSKVGDALIMPAATLACAGVISLCWLFTWDKFKACLLRIRS